MKLSLINVFVFILARYMNHDIFIYTGKLTQTVTGMTSAQCMIDMCKDWQYNLKFALLNLTSAPQVMAQLSLAHMLCTSLVLEKNKQDKNCNTFVN